MGKTKSEKVLAKLNTAGGHVFVIGDAAKLDRLELRIRRVKCLAETGLDWIGNDEIAMGGTTACALRDNGNAYCWGRNDFAQLGDSLKVTPIDSPRLVTAY